MVPSSALERDDAALGPSGIVALLFHVALFLFWLPFAPAISDGVGVTDHVFRVRLTQFSSIESFRSFARNRVFSHRRDGAAAALGSVLIPSTLLPRDVETRRAPGEVRPGEPVAPLPRRIFHGGADVPDRTSFLDAPEAPEASFSAARGASPSDLPAAGTRDGLDAPAGPGGRFAAGDRPAFSSTPTRATGLPAQAGPEGPTFSARPSASISQPAVFEGSGLPATRLPPGGTGLTPAANARSAGPVNVGEITQAVVDDGRAPPLDPRARRTVRKVEPPYPDWAREQRIEPTVKFYVLVAPEGHVLRVLFAKRSGHPEIDRLAMEAVRQWLYEAVPGGALWREATIEFQLRPPA